MAAPQTAWTGFGDYVESLGTPMSGGGASANFQEMLEAALAKEEAARPPATPPASPSRLPPSERPTPAKSPLLPPSERPTPSKPRRSSRLAALAPAPPRPPLLERLPADVARRAYGWLHPLTLARAAAASRALKEAAWDGYGKGERFAWDGETVDEFGAVHTSETQNWPIDVSACRLTLARHKRLDALFCSRDNDDAFYFCATCYATNRDGSPRELPGPWPGDARLSANLDLPVLKGGGLAAEDIAFLVQYEDDMANGHTWVVHGDDVPGWREGDETLEFRSERVMERIDTCFWDSIGIQLCALLLGDGEPRAVFVGSYVPGRWKPSGRVAFGSDVGENETLQLGADPGPVLVDGRAYDWRCECTIVGSDPEDDDSDDPDGSLGNNQGYNVLDFSFDFLSSPRDTRPRTADGLSARSLLLAALVGDAA